MKKAERTALVSIPIVILAGVGLAWAGSQGGATILEGVPLFGFGVGLAFLINWLLNWFVFTPVGTFHPSVALWPIGYVILAAVWLAYRFLWNGDGRL